MTGTLLADRYRVVDRLGSGGAATVLLAEDERLGRRVAVKRLHAHGPDEMAERFEREARLGASLNHQNLVSVFDVATDDEDVLIVMEYVEGEPLSQQIRRGPLRPERVVAIVGEVAAALDHAHSHGVVHRDVKPANILLRHDGVAKLVDLGIATAYEATGITGANTILGTAAYMAPEQIDGERVGPAADVYALAAVTYEMLAGERANQGSTPVEIARRITEQPPPDLLDARPDAPSAAADVLRRGLAREPGARPLSAGRFAADLSRAFETNGPKPAAAAAPLTAATRKLESYTPEGRRDWRRFAPFAALLALALALAVVALASGGGDQDGEDSARPGSDGTAQKKSEPKGSKQQPQQGAGTAGSSGGSADGASLNRQGHTLMQQGRYEQAIPILQRAVDSFSEGTSDLTYAYALYNLGRSLRLAGRPEEAIPILERRLRIPNQTGTVQRELDAARAAAGRSGGGESAGADEENPAKGNDKDKRNEEKKDD